MPNATKNLTMPRGDSATLEGIIRPGRGGALSLPIATLVFTASGEARGTTYSITKTLDDGITLTDPETSQASYEIEIEPADTALFPSGWKVSLTYTLVLTEGNDRVSTVVGGILTVTPH